MGTNWYTQILLRDIERGRPRTPTTREVVGLIDAILSRGAVSTEEQRMLSRAPSRFEETPGGRAGAAMADLVMRLAQDPLSLNAMKEMWRNPSIAKDRALSGAAFVANQLDPFYWTNEAMRQGRKPSHMEFAMDILGLSIPATGMARAFEGYGEILRKAAKPRARPRAEAMTTVYRGGNSADSPWWTTNRDIAEEFLSMKVDRGGAIYELDVPSSVVDRGLSVGIRKGAIGDEMAVYLPRSVRSELGEPRLSRKPIPRGALPRAEAGKVKRGAR